METGDEPVSTQENDIETDIETVNMPGKKPHQMGILSCASYVVGSIIGTGIFITPNNVLRDTQSVGLDLLVWLLCGITSLIGGLVYIELATAIPEPGCDFAYTVFVGWEAIAFGFMWISTFLSYPASAAVQAQTFAKYIVKGFTADYELQDPFHYIGHRALALALISFLTVINFYSIRRVVGRFQTVTTIAKVFIVIIIMGAGIYHFVNSAETAQNNFADPFNGSDWSVEALGSAFYMGLFAYSGWEVLNYGTPEIRNPTRTMPLSLIGGISFVTLVYVLINTAYFLALSKKQILNSEEVAVSFAQHTFGIYSSFLPVMVAITVIGSLNSTIFCSSRFMQAAARKGHLPKFLSALNEKSNSPRASLIAQMVFAAIFCFVPTDALINYVSFVIWGQKAVTLTALLYIRLWKMPVADGVIRMPLPLIFLFWIISATLFVSPLFRDFQMTAISAAIVVCGLAVYFFFVRRKEIPVQIKNANDYLGKIVCRLLNCKLDQAEPKCTELVVKPANEIIEPMDPFTNTKTLSESSETTEVDVVFEKK